MSECKNYNPIDVILDWKLDFCLGSVVNCLSNITEKTNFLDELKKARLFLDKEIELCEKNTPVDSEKPKIEVSIRESEEKLQVSSKEESKQVEKVVDIPKVFALRKAGWSQAKIADEFGVSQGRISQILKKQESR